MKAVVFHDVGDIRLEDVPEPKLQDPTDAIVRLTASAICGTDLHMVRGTLPGMKAGTILGHEGVGVVDALGPQVRNLAVGDRVIIPSTESSCRFAVDGEGSGSGSQAKLSGAEFGRGSGPRCRQEGDLPAIMATPDARICRRVRSVDFSFPLNGIFP
jgi:threonine dehydrogenase-like Zn-dependent dehydrogenase